MNEIIKVPPLTNRDFLSQYAQPGRLGLMGGTALIEQVIRFAQRRVEENERKSLWSHALLFEGPRVDGQHWVIESDLQIHRKHIQLGVQENRVAKYHDETAYPNLAVLDFHLSAEQVAAVLGAGLDMLADHAIYSLRELLGTAVALRHPWFRSRQNLLARKKSCYCSAFVQYAYHKAGLDLTPGVHPSHGSPAEIFHTAIPHTTYLLQRA